MLPTGQVLFNDGIGDLDVYNAVDHHRRAATTRHQRAHSRDAGDTYTVSGTQLERSDPGRSVRRRLPECYELSAGENHQYGDGDGTYARTSSMTSMSVAPERRHGDLHAPSGHRDRREYAGGGRERDRFVVDSDHRWPVRDPSGIAGFKIPRPSLWTSCPERLLSAIATLAYCPPLLVGRVLPRCQVAEGVSNLGFSESAAFSPVRPKRLRAPLATMKRAQRRTQAHVCTQMHNRWSRSQVKSRSPSSRRICPLTRSYLTRT